MTEYLLSASVWSVLGLLLGIIVGRVYCVWKDNHGK